MLATHLASLLLGGTLVRASTSQPKSVNVALETSWPASDLLFEILEQTHLHSPEAYHPFLVALTSSLSSSLASLSPSELYNRSLVLLADHIHPSQIPAWKLGLASHETSPLVEAILKRHDAELALPNGQWEDVSSCGAWVEWRGRRGCAVEGAIEVLGLGHTKGKIDWDMPESSSNSSHDYDCGPFSLTKNLYLNRPQIEETSVVADVCYLYFHPSSELFPPLLEFLSSFSELPVSVRYRSDPKEPLPRKGKGGNAGGWGVEMVLKKMEYSSVDDRVKRDQVVMEGEAEDDAGTNRRTSSPVFESLGHPSWEETSVSLDSEQLSSIPLSTIPLLLSHPSPLTALENLSQNFPLYTHALVRPRPNASASDDEGLESPEDEGKAAPFEEVWHNRRLWDMAMGLQPGQPVPPALKKDGRFWLNGREITDANMNVFDLLPHLRTALSQSLSLVELGFTPAQAYALLTLQPSSQTSGDDFDALFDGLFDASDRPEGGMAIDWMNDLEMDSKYANWPSTLAVLLRGVPPGSLPQLRRNLFNVVLSLDLSTVDGLQTLVGPINSFVQRGLGLRFGVVDVLEGEYDPATIMSRITRYLTVTYGRTQATRFLTGLVQSSPSTRIPQNLVQQSYNHFVSVADPLPVTSDPNDPSSKLVIPEVLPFEQAARWKDEKREEAMKAWGTRLAVHSSLGGDVEQDGKLLFVNGKVLTRDDTQLWLRNMQVELKQQIDYITNQLHSQSLVETPQNRIEASTYFYDLPQAQNRRRIAIWEAGGNVGNVERELSQWEKLLPGEGPGLGRQWIYPDAARSVDVSVIIAGDLDSQAGLSLVREAVLAMSTSLSSLHTPFRLTFVHNPSPYADRDPTPPPQRKTLLSTVLYEVLHDPTLSSLDHATLLQIVLNADVDPTHESATQARGTVELAKAYWARGGHQLCNSWQIGGEDELAIIINGRVVVVQWSADDFQSWVAEDIHALVGHEMISHVRPVAQAIKGMYADADALPRDTLSNLVSSASPVVVQAGLSSRRDEFDMHSGSSSNLDYLAFKDGVTSFETGYNSTALVHVTAILDPLTELAQRWSTTLKVLSEMDFVYVKVILLPDLNIEELPLKRFYRMNLPSEPVFDGEGSQLPHLLRFENLPQVPIYTLGLETPSSWIARPRQSIHDLDNLRLSDLSTDVEPVFELTSLIVEGHAREERSGMPPRGLQVHLTDLEGNELADSLVMANLGYFQLQSGPGSYLFGMRDGRGKEIYEDWATPVAVTKFSPTTLFPRFDRRPGSERKDVLEGNLPRRKMGGPSFISSFTSKVSSFFGFSTDVAPPKKQADINIFTVASGLLYERFAYIMCISVMKHTESTVKFWFIENFLSPSFLEFIPHLAMEYGFDYELVTYKWPTWLNGQKEKQRVIWGYKILFLDVLFPMDLEKVIFVDADQIVRTDLKNLVDEDLFGAPYGYAPMGDDREEMEGFRFWKTGYWKDVLRGRPYHISALYVVDLLRFRQIAAGDRLRGQYAGLSQDPNSLANLDQDLPNSMQDQLRIHTLDRSWLWCATWCSQESLKDAKTIDLCQDPLTKEPKLDRARKIPEWERYDAEVAALALRLSEAKVIKSKTLEVVDLAQGVVKDAEEDSGSNGRVKDEL